MIDRITKKGTIIFRINASAVRDDGSRLQASLGTTLAVIQNALHLAIERYGDRISVDGSPQDAQHTDDRAYHEKMQRYSDLKSRVVALEHEINDDIRRADLAKIHIGKKALDIDEDVYRSLIETISKGRTNSASALTVDERTALLRKFGSLGWKPTRRASPGSRHKPTHKKTVVDKIRATWIQMHKEGVIEDGTEKALGRYCHRMSGKYSPDWLYLKGQLMVLESLKQWRKRQWRKWYREDVEQIQRVIDTEGGMRLCRVQEMIDDGQIRYHNEFADWGVKAPQP
ncbi:MAG: DUF1018 domain-containing protein [Candidatus Thiodiazotropha sp.]